MNIGVQMGMELLAWLGGQPTQRRYNGQPGGPLPKPRVEDTTNRFNCFHIIKNL